MAAWRYGEENYASFALAKAGYTRSSYYKHIRDPDLPYHILAGYGKAIEHDFTEELPEMPQYMIEEPDARYT